MRKRLITIGVVVGLLALPFAIHGVYRLVTALPDEVTIATGPEHGRYRVVAASLGREIEQRLGVRVRFVHTSGSLENLRLIREGQADFALFQPGTHRILDELPDGPHQPAFVANLYSEVVHLIVRRDAGIRGPDDLQGRRMAIGERRSGDYAMSRVLLEHLGLDERRDIEPLYISFEEIRRRFEDQAQPLDAAFVTVGVQAPILRELFRTGRCDILPIPHVEALAAHQLSLEPWTLPTGLYRSREPVEPPSAIRTVAVRAQLLTSEQTSTSLVAAVTGIVLAEEFIKQNSLSELFSGGREFARRKPDFAIHAGAQNAYEPELRPLLDPDFVEATEGMRSFIVSMLIAGFLAFRWYRQRAERRQEHRLDKYIQALLDIERRQLDLDQHEGHADIGRLQELLDEVTTLRREALRKLTAHELKEDRAADCFLEMCHSLSDKINAKLSRQRLDKRFAELLAAFSPAAGPEKVAELARVWPKSGDFGYTESQPRRDANCEPTRPTKNAARDDGDGANGDSAAGHSATADTPPTDRPSSAAR